jgi:hypothetical protein
VSAAQRADVANIGADGLVHNEAEHRALGALLVEEDLHRQHTLILCGRCDDRFPDSHGTHDIAASRLSRDVILIQRS